MMVMEHTTPINWWSTTVLILCMSSMAFAQPPGAWQCPHTSPHTSYSKSCSCDNRTRVLLNCGTAIIIDIKDQPLSGISPRLFDQWKRFVTIEGAGLTQLPDVTPLFKSHTQTPPELLFSMSFKGNSLTSLPPTFLDYMCAHLLRINLAENSLTQIPAHFFRNCSILNKIDLKDNQLSSLPMDLFVHNKDLRNLFVSGNPLGDLSVKMFLANVNIQTLDGVYFDENRTCIWPGAASDFSNSTSVQLVQYNRQVDRQCKGTQVCQGSGYTCKCTPPDMFTGSACVTITAAPTMAPTTEKPRAVCQLPVVRNANVTGLEPENGGYGSYNVTCESRHFLNDISYERQCIHGGNFSNPPSCEGLSSAYVVKGGSVNEGTYNYLWTLSRKKVTATSGEDFTFTCLDSTRQPNVTKHWEDAAGQVLSQTAVLKVHYPDFEPSASIMPDRHYYCVTTNLRIHPSFKERAQKTKLTIEQHLNYPQLIGPASTKQLSYVGFMQYGFHGCVDGDIHPQPTPSDVAWTVPDGVQFSRFAFNQTGHNINQICFGIKLVNSSRDPSGTYTFTVTNRRGKTWKNVEVYVSGLPTSAPPTTQAPTTLPTTEAPTTTLPTTEAPTTTLPTTEAPTTTLPTTEAPTTTLPTTEAPTTTLPTTEAPTTTLPTTEAPTTTLPSTVPVATGSGDERTDVPTTEAPTTSLPTTQEPTTDVPTTDAPTTSLPSTVPVTSGPATHAPTAQVAAHHPAPPSFNFKACNLAQLYATGNVKPINLQILPHQGHRKLECEFQRENQPATVDIHCVNGVVRKSPASCPLPPVTGCNTHRQHGLPLTLQLGATAIGQCTRWSRPVHSLVKCRRDGTLDFLWTGCNGVNSIRWHISP